MSISLISYKATLRIFLSLMSFQSLLRTEAHREFVNRRKYQEIVFCFHFAHLLFIVSNISFPIPFLDTETDFAMRLDKLLKLLEFYVLDF